DTGGRLVAAAVQIGAARGLARVPLVEPGLVVAARTAPAGTALARGDAGAARLPAPGRGLPPGPPAQAALRPSPRPPPPPLFGAQQLRGLPELPRDLGPREIAAERRVRDPVVGGERPQRLAGRPPPKQLRVGNEPAQSSPALHLRSWLDLLR